MPSQLIGAADSSTGLVVGATAVEMTAPVSNKALAAVTAAGSDSASDKGSGGKPDDPEHAVLPTDKQTFTKPVSYFSLYKYGRRCRLSVRRFAATAACPDAHIHPPSAHATLASRICAAGLPTEWIGCAYCWAQGGLQ